MRLGLSGALAAVRLLTVTVLAVGGVGAAGSVLSACSGSANDAIDTTGTKLAATRDSGTGSTGTKSGSVDGGEVDASGDDDTGDASTANDAGATDAAFDASHIIPFVDAGSSVAHKTGQTLVVNGTTRTYDITIPSSCSSSKKVPLVFVFHGDDGKGSDMYGAAFPIETAAAAAGDEAIFVYPDGLDDNENGSAWNIYDDPGAYPYTKADPSGNEDVDYFDALVKTLGGLACGDTGHVFITGFSNGGYLTNQLARWRSSVVKAAAPQSGGPPAGAVPSDYPTAPYCVGKTKAVPTLVIHGQSDGTVAPALGEQAVSYWNMANSCEEATSNCSSSTNTLVSPPATPATAVSPSPCVTSTGCAAGEPVTFCFIPGMGHSIWSSAPGAIWSLFASAS